MKNKLNSFKNKKYLLLFAFVMIINIALTGILFRVSYSQTKKDDDFSSQQAIKAEVTEQKDSPIRITIVHIDNSALSHQEVIFSLQNTSNKSIRAYTLLGNGKRSGKILTSFFVAKLLRAGESEINSYPVERQNVTEGETIFLSIDYVEFDDGSSWGNDSTGKSKEIAGEREGVKAAINQLKNLIKNQNAGGANSLANLLKQDLQEIKIDIPDVNQSDEWKKGFRMGYRTVFSVLKREKVENLIQKLDELEKNFK